MKATIKTKGWSGAKSLVLLAGVLAAVVLGVAGWAASAYGERTPEQEALWLQMVTDIEPGGVIGEIGAGDGRMAVQIARLVGPEGRVYATELDPALVAKIRTRAGSAGVGNLTAVTAAERSTNLPPECCDAVFMRRVYHDLSDPADVLVDIRRALKPGGRLAVIDFEPTFLGNLLMPRRANRQGHGIEPDDLVREVRASGFSLKRAPETWPDDNMFVAVFSR